MNQQFQQPSGSQFSHNPQIAPINAYAQGNFNTQRPQEMKSTHNGFPKLNFPAQANQGNRLQTSQNFVPLPVSQVGQQNVHQISGVSNRQATPLEVLHPLANMQLSDQNSIRTNPNQMPRSISNQQVPENFSSHSSAFSSQQFQPSNPLPVMSNGPQTSVTPQQYSINDQQSTMVTSQKPGNFTQQQKDTSSFLSSHLNTQTRFTSHPPNMNIQGSQLVSTNQQYHQAPVMPIQPPPFMSNNNIQNPLDGNRMLNQTQYGNAPIPSATISGSVLSTGVSYRQPFVNSQTAQNSSIPPPNFTNTPMPQQNYGNPNAPPIQQGPPQSFPQSSQPRRLDPEQMPSPIQVIEDDRENRAGVFNTQGRGLVPPLITTPIICEDGGNCSPRMLRSTMYNIPISKDMLKQCEIPMAVTIQPFALLSPNERPLAVVDLGEMGPIRCKRCKAYMCNNMQFIDGGRLFQCCFCSCVTEVPPEYFAHLGADGKRTDANFRPELSLGAYEFIATKAYCKNDKLPIEPAFIFMIDVSYNAIRSGLVHLLCSRLRQDILQFLPCDTYRPGFEQRPSIRVGFVTFHRQVHFYNLHPSLAQPQMMVVSDINDMFVPLVDGFLVNIADSVDLIDALLEQIPRMFSNSRETETILGPVIEAGLDALQAAERSGKLFVFNSSLPLLKAPGSLSNRDDRNSLGTDKEKVILSPNGTYFTKLAEKCVAASCGIDLYLTPNTFIDVATIGELTRITGGAIHKYQYFQADIDGNRLINDLRHNISKPIGFDSIMRVRTSTGIRPTDFLGDLHMSNTTDIELTTIDSDKSIAVEILHDDKLKEEDGACIQVALLYTSCSGQRRLRILNLALNCTSQMPDVYRSCELDVCINFLSKFFARETLKSNPKAIREKLMNQVARILATYRKMCASPSSAAGQLILPECMKLLPLYSNCILKSPSFQGAAEISVDDRSYMLHMLNGMSVRDTAAFFYPRLISLTNVDLESSTLPTAIRCSQERLRDDNVYLLENGLQMFIWVGLKVDPNWIENVFSVQSAAQIDIDSTTLQDLDNPISRRVRGIVKKIRSERTRQMKLIIVRQRDKLEPIFNQFLVEDKSGISGAVSYVDFLCHIHKEIRAMLS